MSDNLELSASITTEEPEVAATLSDLRYLVFQGLKGDTGDSAYEEAVSLGFVGTEAEWIASLKGAKGDTGYSPEIRVTDITGGHRLDIYNELGHETVDVMDGVDGADGEDGEDGVSPTVTVTDIAGGHRVTIADATHPQGQSFAVMNGSGIPEDVKVALLDCFENVAWINDDGQTYYDALYAALYPPKTLVSISAVFTQGSAVIYDTDSLDTLKQYLTVTATYDDSSTGVVTNYTLSGTLTVGTSTITVLYSGKTTTFDVTVSAGGLLYSLENYAFSNERVIPGVFPFATEDADITVEVDITLATLPNSGSGSNPVIINLSDQAGTNFAMAFIVSGDSNNAYWMGTYTAIGTRQTGQYKIVLTHQKNSGVMWCYLLQGNGTKQSASVSHAFATTSKQFSFGQGSSGSYVLPTGTINKAYIYSRVLSDDAIDEFLGVGGA